MASESERFTVICTKLTGTIRRATDVGLATREMADMYTNEFGPLELAQAQACVLELAKHANTMRAEIKPWRG